MALMRKVLLFILCLTMLVGGMAGVIFEPWYPRVVFFRFVVDGGLLASTGAYLFWTDFIAPRIGIKTWEDS
jgi:hypothetical protein